MKHSIKTIFTLVALSLGATLALTGCDEHPPTSSDNPGSLSDYTTFELLLPEGERISCIKKGTGNRSVLSCIPALDSGTTATPASLGYRASYRTWEDGRVVPCIEKGASQGAVISCVAFPKSLR